MRKLFAVILSLGLIMAPIPMVSDARASEAAGYAKQILGIANGVMGASILVKCKLGATQFSLPVYLAGGLAYIASEVLSGKKKAEDIAAQGVKLEELKAGMVEGGDYQKAAIQAQIDNEKSNLAFVQKRRKWMLAIKIIYVAATALAVLEMVLRYPPAFKPDLGGCSPDGVSHKPVVAMLAAAYGVTSATSGNLMYGALAAGAAYFYPKVVLASDIADKAISILNPAEGRIGFFGASAALVFVIDACLAKEEKAIEKRIADLEKVRDSLPGTDNELADGTATEGAAGGTGGGRGDVNDPSKKNYALKALPKGTELAKHCYANGSKGLEYSTSSCRSPLKLVRPKFDANVDIPALRAGANTGIDFAQAIANGDLGRADIEAGNLAAQAGRLTKIKDDLLKKANEKLKAEGKKPIDIDGELQRQLTALNNGLNQEKPGSGNFSLADLQGGEAATSEDLPGADANASDIGTAATAAAITVPTADGMDISGIGEGEMNDESLAGQEKVASLEDSLNEFESSEDDISNQSDVSIFKQLSNRYFLNYTKIFNRKEISPPLEEPNPKEQ